MAKPLPNGDWRRAELARLAELDPDVEYQFEAPEAAARLGIPVNKLHIAVRKTRQRTEPGMTPTYAQTLPSLPVRKSDYPAAAKALLDIFGEHSFFDCSGLVKVTIGSTGIPVITRFDEHRTEKVQLEAHELCRPIMFGRDGGAQPATLPERVANMVLAWHDRLRRLNGIATGPLLEDDGTIRHVDGYDLKTGLWCSGIPNISVSDEPSFAAAKAAFRMLRDSISTFPFADSPLIPKGGFDAVDLDQPPGEDESACLIAMMTAVCRPSLWLAPALMINAPPMSGAGTGKGLMVRAICEIAFGCQPKAFTAGAASDELDKRLTAALFEGAPCMLIDNVNDCILTSSTLASVLTERPTRARIMGKSRMADLYNTAFLAVTGNGVRPAEDLVRRFLRIEFDARCEDPEQRKFAPGFLDRVRADRERLLGAVLTIWRWGRQNYCAEGRPLGSYEMWAQWCRDPLLALGCRDPVERIAQLKAVDRRRQNIAAIFAAWDADHRTAEVRSRDLSHEVRVLIDPKGKGESRQRIDRWLSVNAGTRVAGCVLERRKNPGRWSPATYRLRRVEGADS